MSVHSVEAEGAGQHTTIGSHGRGKSDNAENVAKLHDTARKVVGGI